MWEISVSRVRRSDTNQNTLLMHHREGVWSLSVVGEGTDRRPIILCPPLAYTGLIVEQKVAAAASGDTEPSDKDCETADALASFTSKVWKHFDFIVSRNVETIFKRCRIISNTHLQHFLHML